MKTIKVSDETYEKIKEQIEGDKKIETKILNRAGDVIFTSDKPTLKEAVIDADLRDADLRGADLRDADLRDADLRGANLRNADLRDADLFGANLFGADLFGADLRGADLFGANLRDAELENARFYGKGGTKELSKEQLPDFLRALGFIIEDN